MTRKRADKQGQVLVLFVFVLIGMFAMLALAIDVNNVYASRRAYRAAADAAALAGGQELQVTGTRTVSPGVYADARDEAANALASQLGGAKSCSPLSGLSITCTFGGTPLVAKIRTPINSGECVSCDPERSIEVAVGNPNFGVSFARMLGIGGFNVSVGAVAGLSFEKSYAIITLRPPKKLGATLDVNDISLNGGSQVVVHHGDVGSNANMVENASTMVLDSGYRFYYYPAPPPDDDPGWSGLPPGVPHLPPITDPGYRYPAMAGIRGVDSCSPAPGSNCAPTFIDARANDWATLPGVDRADNPDGVCAAEATKVDPTRYTFMATQPLDKIYCYSPGIYETASGGGRDANITVGPADVALLLPGAYYLKSGMTIGGRLIGGYEENKPGVALMFDEVGPGNNPSNIFSGNSALTISLNAGTKFPATATTGTVAQAAIDWDGQRVETSGPSGPTPAILISLLVKVDTNDGGSQACVVPTSGTFREPPRCEAQKNQTVQIAGNGNLILEGVQYMPTDNVNISGNASTFGRFGQIISWTLTYSGQIRINQEGTEAEGPGILRLDGACTAPGTPCAP